jgi:hypothetical protein
MLLFRFIVFVLHGVPESGMEIGKQLFPILWLVIELYSTERVLCDDIVELGVCDVHIILFRVPINERCSQVNNNAIVQTDQHVSGFLRTICSKMFSFRGRSETAKYLKHDSFAFIFGFLFFISLFVSSALTYLFVQGTIFVVPVNSQVIIK